ncbi:ABC transporter substrate-binding protein [Rubrimonas cliftonensis]|uniref:Peptide/nickel transport system substrate-binding protein n=1 Tax=Rubrimonas cliftonensis TaxID=89524 RepID=A0A1H4E4N1_9RHOB|nr:ABC transporter substrate-binding protein [Rubrimonas cliftonensis]SEA79322.1 peptide/nickel transport system substrate-binding protein [Rubrimonas cliftonensis]
MARRSEEAPCETLTGARPHPAIAPMARAARAGRLERREFLAGATALGATAGAALGLLGEARAALAQAGAPPKRGGTLRVGMTVHRVDDPRRFDWPEPANIARQFVEPLVRQGADFTLRPWLLEGWEVSDDARAYTLSLRRGVTWSNGDPFEAVDVLRAIERWCDAAAPGNSMAARFAVLVDPATRRLRDGAASAVDSHTVRLDLPRPDVTLIPGMADYPALLTHRDFEASGADLTANPVGTGPFRLDFVEPGAAARVVRSERPWWGGEVWLDAVEWFDLGADPANQRDAFARDAIDVNAETPAGFVEPLDALGLARGSVVTANTVCARMKTTAPPYGDATVRRALQGAVDNAVALALGYGGAGLVAENHHVGPMHPDYARIDAPRFDPAATGPILAEAGHAGTVFELVVADDDWRRNTADAIVAQLLDAGVNAVRRLAPVAEFERAWKDYPFSVTNWNARPLGVQILALGYRTGAAWNETDFSDPEFDATLDAALATVDPVARRAPMARLQTILRDSGVLIQPYWRTIFSHANPRVRGRETHPSFEQHFEGVWLADP